MNQRSAVMRDIMGVLSEDEEGPLDLSRQSMIVNGEGMGRMEILIVGAGAIGSNVAYLLSAMGTGEEMIQLYDFDEVERPNIAPARFRQDQIGMPKARAVAEGIKDELGVETVMPFTVPFTDKIGGKWDVVISCPDNMKTRQEIWNNQGLEFRYLIDARMGRDNAEIYCVGPGREGRGLRLYERVIGIEDTELECGEKATAPVCKGIIPGLVCSAVANIANGIAPPTHSFFSMNSKFWLVQDADLDEVQGADVPSVPTENRDEGETNG